MMKLKQFLKNMQEAIDNGSFTGNEEMVMSKDGEGNEWSPLSDYGAMMYIKENSYSGEVRAIDEYEEEGLTGGIPAVVLWPVN
jgi:hypothetical protein